MFFLYLDPEPDPDWEKNPGSGSVKNESGSETLILSYPFSVIFFRYNFFLLKFFPIFGIIFSLSFFSVIIISIIIFCYHFSCYHFSVITFFHNHLYVIIYFCHNSALSFLYSFLKLVGFSRLFRTDGGILFQALITLTEKKVFLISVLPYFFLTLRGVWFTP